MTPLKAFEHLKKLLDQINSLAILAERRGESFLRWPEMWFLAVRLMVGLLNWKICALFTFRSSRLMKKDRNFRRGFAFYAN